MVIAGDVDEGYGKLADAFRRNLHSGKEIGAALAVYRDGVKVVDLWGGYRNGITKAPWRSDTVVPIFPPPKGCRLWRSPSLHRAVCCPTTRKWPTTGPTLPRLERRI